MPASVLESRLQFLPLGAYVVVEGNRCQTTNCKLIKNAIATLKDMQMVLRGYDRGN